ncbi:adhesion G protein-coupled receptor E3 [Biomphalaria pfeifferi]|uniref:Adhesion G protein-coupled receptor E3 n=1 Tax=Biomphalaria pfeifferi TaxID=112525 RepID=A0AAD8BKP3_BIOPF|nr:adhesion G protein-coupled receptor E3 [Biomphalaria pfeifferi]
MSHLSEPKGVVRQFLPVHLENIFLTSVTVTITSLELFKTANDIKPPALWAFIQTLGSRSLTRDSFEIAAANIFFRKNNNTKGSTFFYYTILFDKIDKYCPPLNPVINRRSILKGDTLSGNFVYNCGYTIKLSLTLLCTYLTFKGSNFTVEWNKTNLIGSVFVTLDVGGTKLRISNLSDMNSLEVTTSNELHICTETLDKYALNLSQLSDIRSMMLALNVLTYKCICASEVSLFLNGLCVYCPIAYFDLSRNLLPASLPHAHFWPSGIQV